MFLLRFTRFAPALALILLPSLDAREGHGTAEWLAESPQLEPGAKLLTVVELTVDPGWHVYWLNPGEAGMPTSVTWELPEGFHAGALQHPWPISFTTGELKGYGHEGRVRYPVVVTAPKDFQGEAVLRGKLSWLACNDESCVPGSADLELTLQQGRSMPGAAADAVAAAHAMAAVSAPEGMTLEVRGDGEFWILKIAGKKAELALGAQAMVATSEVCKPGAAILFHQLEGGKVQARVAKSEYAPKRLESMELWLWPKEWERPVFLKSKAPGGK